MRWRFRIGPLLDAVFERRIEGVPGVPSALVAIAPTPQPLALALGLTPR